MWWSCRRQVSSHRLGCPCVHREELATCCGPTRPPQIQSTGASIKWALTISGTVSLIPSFWEVPDLLDKLNLGISWLTRLVEQEGTETFRSEIKNRARNTILGICDHHFASRCCRQPRRQLADRLYPGRLSMDGFLRNAQSYSNHSAA